MSLNRRTFSLFQNVLSHILFTLFVVTFTAEIDKLLFRALSFRVGWGLVPGGAIIFYLVIVVVIVGGSLAVASSARVTLWDRSSHLFEDNWLFLLNFLGLVVLIFVYWLADTSADSKLLVDILKGFLVCLGSILLFVICSRMRRNWRIYLGVSFVVYCLSIWVDALRPGIFIELVGLGNEVVEGRGGGVSGFNLDPNSGSYIVVVLAVALLDYKRFKMIDLVVLSFAALSILLTLSRSGLLILILTVISYFILIIVKSPERRLFVSGAFGISVVITVICGWAAIRFIEHYENHEAQLAIRMLVIQDEWFRTRLHASNEPLIAVHLQELETFGQVNAPKAPEPTVPSIPEPEPTVTVPISSELSVSEVRSYMTVVDGGEYVHIESRRMARLRNSLDAIAESPFIGHGIGFDQTAGISAHNMFLAMWIDLGLFGLIMYSTFIAVGFYEFYKVKYWFGMFFMGIVGSISMFIQHIFAFFTVFFIMGLVLAIRLNGQTDSKNLAA